MTPSNSPNPERPNLVGASGLNDADQEDRTRLKSAEESSEWFTALFQSSPNCCAVRDLSDQLLAVNDAFLATCGATDAQSVLGKNDAEVFGLDLASDTLLLFKRGLEKARTLPPGQRHLAEIGYQNENGKTKVIYEVTFLPIHSRTGELLATATIAQDVTQNRQKEIDLRSALEKAHQASDAKSIFLGTVSHELRTPLNSVIGLASTLAQNPELTMQTRLSLEWIQSSGEVLLAQIEGLLQYTRLQGSKPDIAAKPFPLLECFTDALRQSFDKNPAHTLSVSYRFDPSLPARITGDVEKLRRIVSNILTNAIKFTDRGSVQIEAHRMERTGSEWMALTVTDTGIGIPSAALELIFVPFYQVDGSDTRRHGGAGLGLAITRCLVEALGGQIEVTSQVGKGTTFRVELPLTLPSSAKLYAPLHEPTLAGRKVQIFAHANMCGEAVADQLQSSAAECEILRPEAIVEGIKGDLILVDVPSVRNLPENVLLDLTESKNSIIWLRSDRPRGRDVSYARQVHLPSDFLPADLKGACHDLLVPEKGSTQPPFISWSNFSGPLAERLPLRILVAEDQESNRMVIRLILRNLGYDPEIVPNGKEAVEAATSGGARFDLILMDLQMPEMDGFEATRRILDYFGSEGGPCIIALTANTDFGVEERCAAVGMSAHIAKPVKPQQIAARLLQSAPIRTPPPVVEFDASAPPVSTLPLVDQERREKVVHELGADFASSLLADALETFESDRKRVLPLLETAAAKEDDDLASELIQELNESAELLGFTRFCAANQKVIEALDDGTFCGWEGLVAEMNILCDQSLEALGGITTVGGE